MSVNSFDIVSKIDLAEVGNAIQQTRKEVATRFDLKGSGSIVELNEKEHKLCLSSVDDYKLKAVNDVLQQKLVRRKIPLKGLSYGAVEDAAGSTVRQEISIQNGIPMDKCRELVRTIKQSKLKVQASIHGDLVRVSAKSRDLLQETMQLIKKGNHDIDIQFTNYRTN